MRRPALLRIMVGSVAGLALLAIVGTRGPGRPESGGQRSQAEFAVTNPADRGPGTLREAIFAASLAPARARVVIRIPRVMLGTPLPPVSRPRGIEIVAADSVAEIDAAGLTDAPVLDLQAPGAVVRGLRIRHAAGIGVLVRVPGVRLLNVECVRCGVGVEQMAGGEGLQVEGGAFIENAVGMRLPLGDAGTAIRRSRFKGNTDAGLWAVGPASAAAPGAVGFAVSDCRFEQNRIGLVVGNVRATIQDNDIVGSTVAGAYLAGRGMTLRHNRVRGGTGVGILAALTEGAIITGNEVDDNRAVGIVVSSGRNTIVQDNRVYRNGYGIVLVFGGAHAPNRVTANSILGHSLDGVFVVGSSPILEGNRALNNRAAGLRILDFKPRRGTPLSADPLLARNVLEGNGTDEPVHGVFRAPS